MSSFGPTAMYGLECFPLNDKGSKALDFTANHFLMKLFKSSDTDLKNECQCCLCFNKSINQSKHIYMAQYAYTLVESGTFTLICHRRIRGTFSTIGRTVAE